MKQMRYLAVFTCFAVLALGWSLLEGIRGHTRSRSDCFPIWRILFAQRDIMAYG